MLWEEKFMNNKLKSLKNFERELSIAAGIVLMTIIFSLINPIFISWSNIKDIIDQATIYGLMGLGMSFAIISGGIDLSAGSILALVAVILAKMLAAGVSPIIAILVAIVFSAVLGLINGVIVTKMRIQPFIATMATMSLFRGIAYLITGGFPITSMPSAYRKLVYGSIALDMRSSVLILFAFAVITHIILKYTKTGNYIYAVGGNEDAANLSGVKCVLNRNIAYIICAIGSALAGIVLLAKLGTAEPTAGNGYELQAIAAVAIGGASMAGGRGTIIGTFLGAIMLTGLKVGLIVIGVDPFWQYIATGLVIVIAVYVEIVQSNIKNSQSGKKGLFRTGKS